MTATYSDDTLAHSSPAWLRLLVRALTALPLCAGLVAVPSAASAQTGFPACAGYFSPTGQYGAGDVRVGMLTSKAGEPNGAVGWLWFIYDPTERAGLYNWQVYINGKPNNDGGSVGRLRIKDDQIHDVAADHCADGELAPRGQFPPGRHASEQGWEHYVHHTGELLHHSLAVCPPGRFRQEPRDRSRA